MITLQLLKYLENNGFGTIDQDLFFQKLTLDKEGIYISDIGQASSRDKRRVQAFELYSRGKNDIEGYKKLDAIIKFLNDSYEVCQLPAVPPIVDNPISNVAIMPMSTITNAGLDAKNRIIYSATGTIIY